MLPIFSESLVKGPSAPTLPPNYFFIYCAVDYHFFIGIGHEVPGCCIRQSKHWEGKGMHERRVDNQWGALPLAKIWFSEWCNPYFSDSWSIFWYVMRGFIFSQPQHIAWASLSLIDISIFPPFIVRWKCCLSLFLHSFCVHWRGQLSIYRDYEWMRRKWRFVRIPWSLREKVRSYAV